MRPVNKQKIAIGCLIFILVAVSIWFSLSRIKKAELDSDQKSVSSVPGPAPQPNAQEKADASKGTKTGDHPGGKKPASLDQTTSIQDLATGEKLSTGTPTPTPALKAVAPDSCFAITYKHMKMSSHSDGEACLRHNNVFSLKSPNRPETLSKVTADSVCIRVNGSAVAHTKVQGKPDEFMIGAVAGPNAKVVVRFCVGKAKCAEKCIIKHDEFMSALGADEEGSASAVGWDGSKEVSKEDSELEAEVAALDKEKGEADSKNKLFTGWIAEDTSAACAVSSKVKPEGSSGGSKNASEN